MPLFNRRIYACALVACLSSSHLATLEGQSSGEASAVFNNAVLTVTGTGGADALVVSADFDDGTLQVSHNGRSVPIVVISGVPNKANLNLVSVDARGGNDTVLLAETLNSFDASGALVAAPNGVILGGGGDDTLASDIGGSLGGVFGNRVIGNVAMDGAGGNDRLISGSGNDLLIGGNGSDTLISRTFSQSDRLEGGAGDDVAEVFGISNNVADAILIRADPATPGEVLVQRTDPFPFVTRVSQIEEIDLRPESGNDSVVLSGLAGTTLKKVSVYGGYGDDFIAGFGLFGDAGIPLRLEGGPGHDILFGGSANDFLDGDHPGGTVVDPDTLWGGPGADVFKGWFSDEYPDFNPAEGDVRF